MPEMVEFKSASQLEFKADGPEGIVRGYASTWDRDLGGDKVLKGAFEEVIERDFPKGKIKIYREHSIAIGLPEVMKEDDTGLWIEAKIVPGASQDGDETIAHAVSGVYDAFSIAYVPDSSATKVNFKNGRRERDIGNFLRLPHTGILDGPMNEGAVIEEAKGGTPSILALLQEIKALLEPQPEQQPLPLVTEIKDFWDLGRAFDARATLEAIRQWGDITDEEAEEAHEIIDWLRATADEAEKRLPAYLSSERELMQRVIATFGATN